MLRKIIVEYHFVAYHPDKPCWVAYFADTPRDDDGTVGGWSGRTPQEAIGTLLMQSGQLGYELRFAEEPVAVGA